MSAQPALPFTEELLSLNDKQTRKYKAIHLMKDYATVGTIRYGTVVIYGIHLKEHHIRNYFHTMTSNRVSCVFGEFIIHNSNSHHTSLEDVCYSEKGYNYGTPLPGLVKNGIEILTAEPNATGRTYSNKCRITVKELKDACKANGIKTTGDKKTLLKALMKV
jgi:hypothetical protein